MRFVAFAVLIGAVAGCTKETEVTPPRLRADLRPNIQYRIEMLPAAPGLGSEQGGAINNAGWVAGNAAQSGNVTATVWKDGVQTPLGTLPGGLRSAVQWPGMNNNGTIVGISRTGMADTLGEAWSCSAFIAGAGKQCLGFFWENGVMSALPTLGGTNGFATGVNADGQVVGWAETPVHDPTCTPGTTQVLQFKAVRWEPRRGGMTVLRPYHGDSTSAATAINNRGEAVGISGECDQAVGRKSATHAVIWDRDGNPSLLPTLGGAFWHTPMAINSRGDIVGFGNPPSGDFDGNFVHAFLWTRHGGIVDLGVAEGDTTSQALDINARGQSVGVSCKVVCQAVLWEDGKLIRLNTLVPPGFPHRLWSARSINDAGQITGRLIEAGTNRRRAYIATPIAQP